MAKINFHCLNKINECNYNVNNVDVGDQLRYLTGLTIGCVKENGGGRFLFGDLKCF